MLRSAALCVLLCLSTVATVAAQSTATLDLAWDASPQPDVAGYKILYGTRAGSYDQSVTVGKQTTHKLTGLLPGQRYFIAVQAFNTAGVLSTFSAEISVTTAVPGALGTILLGLGAHPGSGGWFATLAAANQDAASAAWSRLPWDDYNAKGGGVRLATGNLDGDSGNELVVGLGAGSGGWVAILDDAAHQHALLKWIQVGFAGYAASNGEVFPAVGDLDGDGRGEIVLGFGTGGQGWYQIFDDATTGFVHKAWGRVTWTSYNAGAGVTHPAVADVDGDGQGEIVLGLGTGSGGWLEIVNGAAQGFSHRDWVRIAWDEYSRANGTTYPAAGDLDGDGRAEIVVGLGQGSGGWFQILDDATAAFAHVKWDRVTLAGYNAHSGETHPAIGNVDADAAKEIVFGLAEFSGNGGWFATVDDAATGFAPLAWRNVGWPAFTAAGGSLYPAILK